MRSSLIKNVMSLGAMQLTNYLIPLVVIPILISKVGLTYYGLIALVQGVVNILVTCCEFGTNLTGTRSISQQPDNPSIIRETAGRILTLRFTLLLLIFPLFLLLVVGVPAWREEKTLFITSYSMVFGQALFPIWYFQGIQKMQFISVINLIARLLYVLSLFVFITKPSDYLYVNLANGLSWLLTSGVAMVLVARNLHLRWMDLSFHRVREDLQTNATIFFSRIFSTGYRNGTIIIAGSFLSPASLGVFSIFDKISVFLANSASVFFRATLPKASQLAIEGRKAIQQFYSTFFLHSLVAGLVLVVVSIFVTWLARDYVNSVLETETFWYSTYLSALIFTLAINLPAAATIASALKNNHYMTYNVSAFLLLVTLGPILAYTFEELGLLVSIICAELGMFIVAVIVLRRNSIFLLHAE